MNDDFDDLHMRPAEHDSGDHRRPPVVILQRSLWPVGVGAIVLLLAAGGGAFLLTRARPPRAAATVPTVAPPAPTPDAPRPLATPTPDPSLPALDESDSFMRRLAAGLSANPEVARWLARTALVRTLTAVVANIANGETPRRHLELLTPRQRFRAAQGAPRVIADPASYAAYDAFGSAVASVDARAAASAYTASEPLFDAAYRDLGATDGFRSALDTAIHALLAVPVPPDDAELVPAAVGFHWADPALEALTAAQKQLLRTGPRNVRLIQGKLRDLDAALRATPRRGDNGGA